MPKVQYLQNRKIKVAFWLIFALLITFSFTKRGFAQQAFPYTQNFVISAYYSPLLNQERYVTGSYEGDIRLNGDGVKAADNTVVYPGMIAAPPEFPFGTKMNMEGLGVATVHDRGGAIKNKRLDVWMGYGEEGMRRATAWGFREVSVTVYGVDPSIPDTINLSTLPLASDVGFLIKSKYFRYNLGLEDSGDAVYELQRLLKISGYFDNGPTGNYGLETEAAILKFQLERGIVDNAQEYGAGVFGPRTRAHFEDVLDEKGIKPDLQKLQIPARAVPQPVGAFPYEMNRGDRGESVRKLQEELYRLNYLRIEPTGYYGEVTEHAVFKFQQASGLVVSKEDSGAGLLGPQTRATLSGIVAAREDQTRLIAQKTSEMKLIAEKREEVQHLIASAGETVVVSSDLSYGTRGEDVRRLQETLKKLGYFDGAFTTDYFGDATKEAVTQFQKDHGLIGSETDTQAGTYNEATRKIFEEALKSISV